MHAVVRPVLAALLICATAGALALTVAITDRRGAPRTVHRARPPSGFAVHGIDVSHHQGRIDWQRVADSGQVDFAFIKATEGKRHTDRRFRSNLRGARDAGIPVGAYHYFSLCHDGADQAGHFIEIVSDALGDASLDLPPVVDIEEDPRCNRGDRLARAESEVSAWIDAVTAHFGTSPLVYSASGFRKTHLPGLEATYWMAAYSREPRDSWHFWQYTDRSRVPGIRGPVDGDVFSGSPAEFRERLARAD